METVYIETTIPSFYYEVREGPEMIARKNWTRQWWDEVGKRDFDLVTSQAVIDDWSFAKWRLGLYSSRKSYPSISLKNQRKSLFVRQL